MKTRWVWGGVVVLVVPGALAWSPAPAVPEAPAVVEVPAVPPPVVAAVAPPAVTEPARTAPVVALDAGVALVPVRIALTQRGETLVGPRVTVSNDAGVEESRPTTVMGSADFELAPGRYEVFGPYAVVSRVIDVADQPVSLTLALPEEFVVTGRVVDGADAGVPMVDVVLREVEYRAVVAKTDLSGRFAFQTEASQVLLEVEAGTARAVARVRPPSVNVVLRLQPTAPLRVITPAGLNVAITVYPEHGEPEHWQQVRAGTKHVPQQALEVRAFAFSAGRLLWARHAIAPRHGEFDDLLVDFQDAPPILGDVVDANGQPVPGVAIEYRQVVDFPSKPVAWAPATMTNPLGRFFFTPRGFATGDPAFELRLVSPWRETHRVLVRLGDEPIHVVAEPAAESRDNLSQ